MELQEDLSRKVARFVVVSFFMLAGSMSALHYLARSIQAQQASQQSRAR